MNDEKLLICKLCLEKNKELISIFSNNIDAILQQFPHFKLEDSFAHITFICVDCWQKVKDFHDFCSKVEKIHEEACRLAEKTLDGDLEILELLKAESQIAENQERVEEIKGETATNVKDEIVDNEFDEKDENGSFNDDGGSDGFPETESESDDAWTSKRQTRKRPNQGSCVKPKPKRRLKPSWETQKTSKIDITPELEQILKEQLKNKMVYEKTEIDYGFIKKFMPLKCAECKEPFSTFDDSQKHFLNKHKRAGYWKCCKANLETVYDVLDHMKYHRDPDPYKCKACRRTFITTYKLHSHIYTIHFRGKKDFRCDTCDREYKHYHKLITHEKRHIPTDCPHCQKTKTIANLDRHISRGHTASEKIMCDMCGKVSCDKKAHSLHYLVKHSGIDQRMQCDICKKWVKHKKQMGRHMSKHFQTPVVCDICGKTVANRHALSGHKQQQHKERKHKCRYCGKDFVKLKLLREHESIHLGIKDLYQCDFCDKTFRFNSGMYAHRKLAHPEKFFTLGINSI